MVCVFFWSLILSLSCGILHASIATPIALAIAQLTDSFEPAAETNCESLIAKAIALSPRNPEVQLALASIRMSQQKFEEAKAVIVEMYNDIEGKEPCEFAGC
jgi:thioredoxin-like negative regulator of GroEL